VSGYVAFVRTIIAKLVLLVAVLLMPLGMGSAAASAPTIDHHAMTTGLTMDHCPGQPNNHDRAGGMAMCSMACASALPAQDLARDDTHERTHQLVAPMIGRTLSGILPETATPPPKLA
jgi:hypothetical protein